MATKAGRSWSRSNASVGRAKYFDVSYRSCAIDFYATKHINHGVELLFGPPNRSANGLFQQNSGVG